MKPAWKLAVGEKFSSHYYRAWWFLSIILWLTVKIPGGPASIIDKHTTHWSVWQQNVLAISYAVLVSIPGFATTVYLIVFVAFATIAKSIDKIYKAFDWNLGPVQFLDAAFDWILDLTPEGDPPWWALWLFWPFAVYQWFLAVLLAPFARNNENEKDAKTNEMEERFFHAFGPCFDTALVPHLRDPKVAESTITVVLGRLGRLSKPERAVMKNMLLGMLKNWDRSVVDRFVQATNVDWTADAQQEQQLKEIVMQLSRQFAATFTREWD